MPLQATSGAASQDGFGGNGVPVIPNYIEDVFSTWLYTGNASTQTITNGIDLATKGGLVWVKTRSATGNNFLFDTARGVNNEIRSNATNAQSTVANSLTAFNSNGFDIGSAVNVANNNAVTYASWTFRKQPKFFDVLTYTGNGSTQTISHALGVIPAVIILKKTSASGTDWYYCYDIGASNYRIIYLNDPSASSSRSYVSTDMLSAQASTTSFFLGSQADTNDSGATFVAYLFASNAGGFGLTGTDNVISCGSFTTDGTGAAGNITLGYESQWILLKRSDGVGGWNIIDTMRGSSLTSYNYLSPNTSGAESSSTSAGQGIFPTATGFFVGTNFPAASATYIYIAIRRGPMKVPTSGTSVFSPVARTGTGATAQITGIGFTPDFIIGKPRTGYNVGTAEFDRLKGVTKYLAPSWIDDEITDTTMVTSFNMDGVSLGADTAQKYFNGSAGTYINWIFKRAPSFFDEVCYTGTGNNTTITHNLGVVPELIFVKCRSASRAWDSYSSALANTEYIVLNSTAAKATGATRWNSTTPTSSVFSVGTATTTNANASTYVAFLFATCAGVSKVGSYTGNGSTQTINCGFGAGGARFVLIKRTDDVGGWYAYDTARGMTVLTDPYSLINSTDDETATLGSVTTVSTGFAVNASILAAINTNAASYIFLAIA